MSTALFIFAIVIATVAGKSIPNSDLNEIQRINNEQNLWKARWNGLSKKDVVPLLGLKFGDNSDLPVITYENENIEIPETFDARTKWPQCSTISSIKNQGNCGSCWAVSSTSVLSDRLCIRSRGRINLNISAENLLSCCSSCTQPGQGGCDGGYLAKAYDYFRYSGVVTGGDYDSDEGCQPYQIEPTLERMYTPPCQKTCTNGMYGTPYNKDKHYGRRKYAVSPNVRSIQKDIMINGPVTTGFMVYSDFQYYSSGVYVQTSQESLGGHAVRIIGWGTEDDVDYWLVANSWGEYWGEDGTFKIRRGTDECQFEDNVVGGFAWK